MAIRIVGFSGSLRAGSFNRKLLHVAASSARAHGAEVEVLDLREYPFPLYDGDLEAKGLPDPVQRFRDKIAAAHGVILTSPEYNYSISGVMKNAIDWTSRPPPGPWKGKVVALTGATGGPFGVQRMLPDLRKVMSYLQTFVLPGQFGLARASEAFDADGKLADPKLAAELDGLMKQLVEVAGKLNG